MKRKYFSLFMAVVLLVSLAPVGALGAVGCIHCRPGDVIYAVFTFSEDSERSDGVMGRLSYPLDIFNVLPSADLIGLDGFNILPVISFSNAITTFVGQNTGARKPERVRTGLYVTLAMGVGYVIVTGALIMLFGRPLMGIFVREEPVIELGLYIMRFFCPFFALNTIMHITSSAVRGTGRTVPPMLIMLFFLCVFRIIWVNVTLKLFGQMFWVFASYPVSWVLTDLALMIYLRRSNWLEMPEQT